MKEFKTNKVTPNTCYNTQPANNPCFLEAFVLALTSSKHISNFYGIWRIKFIAGNSCEGPRFRTSSSYNTTEETHKNSDVFLTVHHIIDLFHLPTLMHISFIH